MADAIDRMRKVIGTVCAMYPSMTYVRQDYVAQASLAAIAEQLRWSLGTHVQQEVDDGSNESEARAELSEMYQLQYCTDETVFEIVRDVARFVNEVNLWSYDPADFGCAFVRTRNGSNEGFTVERFGPNSERLRSEAQRSAALSRMGHVARRVRHQHSH